MSRSAERIVSLLWLLLEAGATGRTKDEIFSYLYDHQDTSSAAKQRQFSRDKEALTAIGVPVQWHPDNSAEDVYVIDHERLYLPELALTEEEILALHQARALWTKTPVENAIYTALTRITAAQPTVRPIVGAQLAPSQTLLTELVSAAREQNPIRFRYRTVGRQDIAYRRLRPWAVLMAHQHWYVVGWDLDRADERTFRLSRIESNTITQLSHDVLQGIGQTSQRPENFDINNIRQRLRTNQSGGEAKVWIAADTLSSLRVRANVIEQQIGWDLLYIKYQDPLKTAAQIAALTNSARVDVSSNLELAELVDDLTVIVRDAHQGTPAFSIPKLTPVTRSRRRTSDKDVIARRLGIVAVINQHGGVLSRAHLRQRFGINEQTLTDDLTAMQFWGLPEIDFAGGQFELDPQADPVEIFNAELLAQPWQLSAPEALGLLSGLQAVETIPGIDLTQRMAAESLGVKLRDAIDTVDPQIGNSDSVIHPDLSLGEDDELAKRLHQAAQSHRVVTITYYSKSSGSISTREIEPIQLLYASGHGYIRAWCRQTRDYRTFRLDRVGESTETDEYFDPARHRFSTEDIAPDAETLGLSVILHVTHRSRDALGPYHPSARAIASDGSMFAELAFQSMSALLDLLMTHAGQIVVVQPQTVRDTIWQMTHDAVTGQQESAQ